MHYTMRTVLLGAVALLACFPPPAHGTTEEEHTFREVIDVVVQKREAISQHNFFKYLADETIPVTKRMQFTPYWTYFAMTFADIADNWLRIRNPTTELEHRINAFADEDSFHYNLFLHDTEVALGYTLDRFGSYSAVVRHLWGDDSKTVRMLLYSWIAAIKNTDDPMVKFATIETIEAGLKDIFEVTFIKVYNGKDGMKDLKYFGLTHVELEINHTQTSWFKEGEEPFRPLASYVISADTKQKCLEVVEEMFYWFHQTYDYMYNLCVADDSIEPGKYLVEGYPTLHDSPLKHPNKEMAFLKDEL